MAIEKLKPFKGEDGKLLPVALVAEGTKLEPGQVKKWDILLLPKVYAEVAQVTEISNEGTEQEEWTLQVLPLPRTGGATIPWKLTVSQLNGPADATGAHRPIGVVRLGRKLEMRSEIAVFTDQKGAVALYQVNSRGLVLPENVTIPLNAPLRVLGQALPTE
jgi:hypothetical protein